MPFSGSAVTSKKSDEVMNHNHSSYIPQSHKITSRHNNINSINYSVKQASHNITNMDELDTGLCPPALSPYALSILDGKLDRNSLSSKPNTQPTLTLNDLTVSTSASGFTQKTVHMTNTTTASRHSNFMTKLGLGAPRRLTKDGDFKPSRKSMDESSNHQLNNNITNNTGNNSDLDHENPISGDRETEESRQRDLERKRSLEYTPKQYSPLHKRIILNDQTSNAQNHSTTRIPQNVAQHGTPVKNKATRAVNESLVTTPELGRRATKPLNNEQIGLGVNLFDPNKEFMLNLDLPLKAKKPLGDLDVSSVSSNNKENSNDPFDHVKNLLDKKKEIYLLKKEIKQYKEELLKQKRQIEQQEILERKQKLRIDELQERQQVRQVQSDDNDTTASADKIVQIHKHSYKLFEQIGRGGSSKVFRGSLVSKPNHYLAIKIVSLEDQDLSTVSELKGEIKILHKLRHCSRVVRLLDYSLTTEKIFFVMECGDLDLAKVLSARHSMKTFYDLEFIRYHAQEMIRCINEIHKLDVVHLDLKPANFVFVSGVLKLIDFGISNSIKGHTVNVYREYQMGTPNYMAPETLLDCAENENGTSFWKVGKPADIWSLGCILYQLTYGTTPYASYTGTSKILAITNPAININYPIKAVNLRKKQQQQDKSRDGQEKSENLELEDDENVKVCPYLIDMIRKCLMRDPKNRIDSDALLDHIFVNPVVVDSSVINEVVRGCVGFGGRHPELQDIALGKAKDGGDRKYNDRLDRLIDGVWKRVGNGRFTK